MAEISKIVATKKQVKNALNFGYKNRVIDKSYFDEKGWENYLIFQVTF